MGEEQKKAEEPKQAKVEEKTEEPPKTEAIEKKTEENKQEKNGEDDNSAKEPPKETATPPPPPPPPQEIVLKIYMHCEGCARKVKRCLKGFEGVEEVQTDCKAHKVVIKGDKADPLKVLERVQKKSNRKVELLSPIPKPPPPPEEPKKPVEEKEVPKIEAKAEEAQKMTVIVGVHMHCEACAQVIRKRILRLKGVESVEADLKSSLVKVEGTVEAPALVEFIYKKTGKQAKIVKVDPHKKEEEKAKEEEDKGGKEDKGKGGEKAEGEAKGGAEEGEKEKEEGDGPKDDNAGAQPPNSDAPPPKPQAIPQEESSLVELRRNEAFHYPTQNYYQPPPQNYYYYQQPQQQEQYYQQQAYYPQRYGQEMYAHPPQIFSDENPNACSVM